jgi:hypothetical protein
LDKNLRGGRLTRAEGSIRFRSPAAARHCLAGLREKKLSVGEPVKAVGVRL